MSSHLRVFIASSLDGFIAGPNDDISWLGSGPPPVDDKTSGALGYDGFIARIGAILMGRRTYDVVRGHDKWYYGDIPLLVATHRPLHPIRDTVRRAEGSSIVELVADAKAVAGDKDVYIDGGILIRQALDAGLIDEIIVTVIPIVLGAGIPLFAGVGKRHPLTLVAAHEVPGGAVELTYRPAAKAP